MMPSLQEKILSCSNLDFHQRRISRLQNGSVKVFNNQALVNISQKISDQFMWFYI